MTMATVPEEIEVTLGKGVKGTFTIPHSITQENQNNYAPATNKAALILHGQAGHRDYCYQKMLAHRLASDLGVYSLRIDFRGCGSSAECADPKIGRLLEQDVEDIEACVDFIINKDLNPVGINFTLSSIISHSRGGVAMFLWAMKQVKLAETTKDSKYIIVPNLINCSSRYDLPSVCERYPTFDETVTTLPMTAFRHGKYQELPLPRTELISLSEPDLSILTKLPVHSSVLSVYGLKDEIIHVTDSAEFANVLNRGPLTHQLVLLPHADHNFYGTNQIHNESDYEDYNPDGLPLNSKKYVNYNYIVVDKILDYLQPQKELDRFIQANMTIGQTPRWKVVEGVSNFRDFGGWKILNSPFKKYQQEKAFVRPNIMYRCANMNKITENGLFELAKLRVKVIFDLRSDSEIKHDGIPQGFEKYGIVRKHVPVFKDSDYSPEAISLRYSNLLTCWSTYINVYDDILENGVDAFRKIFDHIKNEGTPFVFHCTAGKDRTGVIAMLILALLGVDKHTIAKEYELTTVGLKPDHPIIKEKYLETLDKIKSHATEEMVTAISQGRKGWTLEDDGFNNLISSRYEAMLSTIELVNSKYGGIIHYMKSYLKFTDDDLQTICSNLIDFEDTSSLVEPVFDFNHRVSPKI